MHAASRESLQVVQRRFDEVSADLDSAGLATLADELAAVSNLLVVEVTLRKHLAGKSDESEPKVAVLDSLLAGKVADSTLDIVRTGVEQRWSISRDFTNALERLANLAILIGAERDGQIENVEDELFRFGRTLDANARLSTLLSDTVAPLDGRTQLLTNVLAGKASEFTDRLLQQTLRGLHGRNFEAVVPELAELAAERRGQSVAHVKAASPLSDAQRERLEGVLSRIYGRNMTVQLEVVPEILGGLEITVGDEVVDGTIASRLASAASQLPR